MAAGPATRVADSHLKIFKIYTPNAVEVADDGLPSDEWAADGP